MKIPKKFWKEESKESAHKDIKKQLEKAGSKKSDGKKKDPKPAKHMGKKATALAKNPTSKKAKKTFEKERMHEFKAGHMHSSKKGTGPVVKNPKQAVAIMLSEERKKGVRVPKKKK